VAIEDWPGNEVEKVVLIERDPDVAAVWKTILGNRSEWLREKILNFEMSLSAAEEAVSKREKSVRHRALATMIRNRAIRGGLITPDSGWLNKGEKDKGLNSRWYPETLSERIRKINEVSNIIEFIHGDAFAEWDTFLSERKAAHFIDPPYPNSGTRLYKFSDVKCERVFNTSKEIDGDYLITYESTDRILDICERLNMEHQKVSVKNANHDSKEELLIGKYLKWAGSEPKKV
jgi:DNA adenine methylase